MIVAAARCSRVFRTQCRRASFWYDEQTPGLSEHGERTDAWGAQFVLSSAKNAATPAVPRASVRDLKDSGYDVGPQTLFALFKTGGCGVKEITEEVGLRRGEGWTALYRNVLRHTVLREGIFDTPSLAWVTGADASVSPHLHLLTFDACAQARLVSWVVATGKLEQQDAIVVAAAITASSDDQSAEDSFVSALRSDAHAGTGPAAGTVLPEACLALAARQKKTPHFRALLRQGGWTLTGDESAHETSVQRAMLQRRARVGWTDAAVVEPASLWEERLRAEILDREGDLSPDSIVRGLSAAELSCVVASLCASGRLDQVESLADAVNMQIASADSWLCGLAVVEACAQRASAPNDVYSRLASAIGSTSVQSPALFAGLMRVHAATGDGEAARNLKAYVKSARLVSPSLLSVFKEILEQRGEDAAAGIVEDELTASLSFLS